MRENYIRFENFLAGTGNEFIGRGAPKNKEQRSKTGKRNY